MECGYSKCMPVDRHSFYSVIQLGKMKAAEREARGEQVEGSYPVEEGIRVGQTALDSQQIKQWFADKGQAMQSGDEEEEQREEEEDMEEGGSDYEDEVEQMGRVEDADWELARGGE